ncbi:MAG: hypothetical protein HKL98_01245 [Burkholderiales bacterium]|nr:hypothetical protein [Burkholderiales bacterium]
MLFPLLANAASIEVITLKYRRAEDLIPVIQPLLAKGEAVSGMGDQLIVRTANPREVRRLVEKLDRAPKNLMITVRQGEVSTERESVYGTESASGANESHVRVLEGSPSFISVGRSIPNQVVTMGPYGATVTNTYNEVSSGFYVVATVSGESVSLEASPVYEHPVDGGIDRQRLTTRVTGKIGQWIELGGAGQASSDSDEYHTRTNRIWIRVDLP